MLLCMPFIWSLLWLLSILMRNKLGKVLVSLESFFACLGFFMMGFGRGLAYLGVAGVVGDIFCAMASLRARKFALEISMRFVMMSFILRNASAKIHREPWEVLHPVWLPWVMNQDHQPCYHRLWILSLGSSLMNVQSSVSPVLSPMHYMLEAFFLYRVCPLCGKGRCFICLASSQQKHMLQILQYYKFTIRGCT